MNGFILNTKTLKMQIPEQIGDGDTAQSILLLCAPETLLLAITYTYRKLAHAEFHSYGTCSKTSQKT